ncbi:hypothetical protein DQW77_16095 [Roseovarius sp. TE539]|uniref:hypothetical protein n=1 Tax=Roseovarius sp. TE539 TaxID=2249812 RepID=UPI000DDDC7B3|nr:hypothetical protein [Roseovarius sp. TE539]RBI68996.1 hypothetical protein DQW77_16095 [Roseovarius sp. TE539]
MSQLPSTPPPKKELLRVSRNYLNTLYALVPLLMTYWLLQPEWLSRNVVDSLNALLPIYFMSVLLYLAWRTMRIMPAAIWTGLVWYPVNSAVFYGLGPLVEIFGNEITRAIMSSHYLSITEVELFRAHKLSVTGIFMVLLGLNLHMIVRPRVWILSAARQAAGPVFDPMKLGMAFLVLGASFKYLLLKPAQWGMLDLTVAGVLTAVGNLTDLGFAVIAYCAGRGNRLGKILIWAGLPLHVFISLLALSKLEVILAVLLPSIGYFLGSRRTGKLIRHLILIAIIYAVLQPWVHHGRTVIAERNGGNINLAGYGERMEILGGYLLSGSEREIEGAGEERQGWWTRLNFSGSQAQAMNLYDRGFSNQTLHTAWMYFIPRAIWPEKPILYGPGLNFYRLLSGNDQGQSFLGLSIYGDLYWQFGWTGVIIGCFLFGWLLGITASRALRAVRAQEFVMLPFIMMALQLASASPNKFVINGVIGPLPIMIFYYLVLSSLLRVLRKRSHKSQPIYYDRKFEA